MATCVGVFSDSENQSSGTVVSGCGKSDHVDYAIRTEFEYPWMRTFASEAENRENRKKLLRGLLQKNPVRYGWIVCDFMNGVLVPMKCRLRDLVSKCDVWSSESVQVVYELTSKACELLIYHVPDISEICSLAGSILKDSENEADRIAKLREMVKAWVEHGVVVFPGLVEVGNGMMF